MHVHSRKVGLKCAGPRQWKGVGLLRTQASREELHIEAEIDTERKTSETGVKKHFTEMLKDVGMVE